MVELIPTWWCNIYMKWVGFPKPVDTTKGGTFHNATSTMWLWSQHTQASCSFDFFFLHTTKKKRHVWDSFSSHAYDDAPRADRTNPSSYIGYGRATAITTAATRIVDCVITPPFERAVCSSSRQCARAQWRNPPLCGFPPPPHRRCSIIQTIIHKWRWILLYIYNNPTQLAAPLMYYSRWWHGG